MKESYEKRAARMARKTAMVRELKDRPCMDCGIQYPPEVMDFDHVPGRGLKVGQVMRMAVAQYSDEAIIAEAAKCDVVCSNCHRLRTFYGRP